MTEPVDVVLHAMAHGGEAIGRLPDGRTVFVHGGIPGETVRVEIQQEKKRWARARLVEVVEASGDRREAPCPHFDACGGCQWQHIDLGRQRVLKRDILIGQLQHLAGIEEPPVEDVRGVGNDDGFGYRNHVLLSIDDEGRAGYLRAGTHEPVAVDHCAVLHPLLQEWHEALPPLEGVKKLELRVGTRTAQRLAMTRGRPSPESAEASSNRGIPLVPAGTGELTEMVGTHKLRISSKSFFQVNTEGAETLVDLVLEMLDPGEEDTVVDAYAGVGLFSLPLAERARRVFAVERHPAAVRDLRFHSEEAKTSIHVIATDVSEAFAQLPGRVDHIVADPTRDGLGEDVAKSLTELQPERIVLVACDPAALGRDVEALSRGGYVLERVVGVDMFPHTYHVEAVALLRARQQD